MKKIDEILDLWDNFESRANARRGNQIDQVKEDRRFLSGKQWERVDNKLYPKGRPRKTVNVLLNSVVSTVNSYQSYPFVPYSPVEEIDKLSRAFNKAGQNSRAPYDALFNSIGYGLGYMALGSDDVYDQQTKTFVTVPALYSVQNVENVYFDPDSQNADGSDAQEAAIVEYRSKNYVRMKYGEDFLPEEGFKPRVRTHDNTNGDTMAIVTYFRMEEGKCVVYRLLNEQFLEDPVELGISRIPVWPCYGEAVYDDDDRVIYQGLARKGREIQRTINQAFTQLGERLAMVPKPTFRSTPEAIEGYEDGYRTFQYNLNPIMLYNKGTATEKYDPPERIDNTIQFNDITGIIGSNLELLSTVTGVDAKGLLMDQAPQVTATEVLYNERQAQCTVRHYFQNLKDTLKSVFETIVEILGKGRQPIEIIQGPSEYMQKQVAMQTLMQIAAIVPDTEKMKVVDGVLLAHNDNPILANVFGAIHANPEPSAMEAQAFDTIEQMKQAIEQKNQQIEQLQESIKKMEQNSANNERSITADFMKMKLQHQYNQEDRILDAQLNAGADTVKAEAEIQKANIGVEKELLSLDREKMKTAQAFAQPANGGNQ